jgi:hypothetical protein
MIAAGALRRRARFVSAGVRNRESPEELKSPQPEHWGTMDRLHAPHFALTSVTRP